MIALKYHTSLKTNEQTNINMGAYNFLPVHTKPSESICSSELMERKERNSKSQRSKSTPTRGNSNTKKQDLSTLAATLVIPELTNRSQRFLILEVTDNHPEMKHGVLQDLEGFLLSW